MPLINPDKIGLGLIKIFALEILALIVVSVILISF